MIESNLIADPRVIQPNEPIWGKYHLLNTKRLFDPLASLHAKLYMKAVIN